MRLPHRRLGTGEVPRKRNREIEETPWAWHGPYWIVSSSDSDVTVIE